MLRRSLIAATLTLPVVALPAGAALAAEDAPAVGGFLNLPPVGLPVIEGGRVRNYVFVQARLHLGGGRTPETMSPKIPFFRDALVRAAHRTPFVLADSWIALDGPAMARALMRAAPGIAGVGAVGRVEIVSQAPRRRTGMRGV